MQIEGMNNMIEFGYGLYGSLPIGRGVARFQFVCNLVYLNIHISVEHAFSFAVQFKQLSLTCLDMKKDNREKKCQQKFPFKTFKSWNLKYKLLIWEFSFTPQLDKLSAIGNFF